MKAVTRRTASYRRTPSFLGYSRELLRYSASRLSKRYCTAAAVAPASFASPSASDALLRSLGAARRSALDLCRLVVDFCSNVDLGKLPEVRFGHDTMFSSFVVTSLNLFRC